MLRGGRYEIHCKKCKKPTQIELPEQANCSHCEESIEIKGKFIKGYKGKTVLAAVVIGNLAIGQVDDVLYPEHFPSDVQYAIIETCIAADSAPLFLHQIEKKRDVCICAFDRASDYIGYDLFLEDPKNFIHALHREVDRCD